MKKTLLFPWANNAFSSWKINCPRTLVLAILFSLKAKYYKSEGAGKDNTQMGGGKIWVGSGAIWVLGFFTIFQTKIKRAERLFLTFKCKIVSIIGPVWLGLCIRISMSGLAPKNRVSSFILLLLENSIAWKTKCRWYRSKVHQFFLSVKRLYSCDQGRCVTHY